MATAGVNYKIGFHTWALLLGFPLENHPKGRDVLVQNYNLCALKGTVEIRYSHALITHRLGDTWPGYGEPRTLPLEKTVGASW